MNNVYALGFRLLYQRCAVVFVRSAIVLVNVQIAAHPLAFVGVEPRQFFQFDFDVGLSFIRIHSQPLGPIIVSAAHFNRDDTGRHANFAATFEIVAFKRALASIKSVIRINPGIVRSVESSCGICDGNSRWHIRILLAFGPNCQSLPWMKKFTSLHSQFVAAAAEGLLDSYFCAAFAIRNEGN